MYTVFNGRKDEEVGISTLDIPNTLFAYKKNYDVKTIQGREGNLNIFTGYSDSVLPVKYNFYDFKNLTEKWISIKSFFKNITDNRLYFSEFPDYFVKVKYVNLTSMDRVKSIGRFTADYVCEPFLYLEDGLTELVLNENNIIVNSYDDSKPLFKITGEGPLKINLNGIEFKFNVGQSLIVDADKQLCYRNETDFINPEMSGDFDKLILKTGDNIIQCSPGFNVILIPNWRVK